MSKRSMDSLVINRFDQIVDLILGHMVAKVAEQGIRLIYYVYYCDVGHVLEVIMAMMVVAKVIWSWFVGNFVWLFGGEIVVTG